VTHRAAQFPSAEQAGGHCPIPEPRAAGVFPAAECPVQGCPVGQTGGKACRTVPPHRAPCPVVVSLPPVGAAVLSMHSRQLPAVGSTLHSRGTAQQDTGPSVPQCLPVIPCAGVPMGARSMRPDRVVNRPQWPITGRSPAVRWSGKGLIPTSPSMAGACVSHATTGTPPVTPPPVEEPGRPDHAGRGRGTWSMPALPGRARRRPQGVTPPPRGKSRSSARPACVPTHFRHPLCTSSGRR
jgi:hypothetical protein